MFVPSLSWQNDAFYIKTAQKWRCRPRPARPRASPRCRCSGMAARDAVRSNCLEPVLVKTNGRIF
eukprot:COSAG06_NODE_10763_length_1621_cov_2.199080_2_plen_65_part_00